MKSRLNGKNNIKAMNTCAGSSMGYGAGILKWTIAELDEMDRKTRKIMMINKEFHPKSDVDRLYVTRSKGVRGLIGCKSCVVTEENGHGWYLMNHSEPLLIAVRESKTLPDCDKAMKPIEFKIRKQNERISKWKDKKMRGQYLREVNNKDQNSTWRWVEKSDLKGCTEALICNAQKQALRTNYIKFHIDRTNSSTLCRMCSNKGKQFHTLLVNVVC